MIMPAYRRYAHLSLEFPHLNVMEVVSRPEDLVTRMGRLQSAFASGTSAMVENLPAGSQPRISTAVLVETLNSSNSYLPREVIPLIIDAAAKHGIAVDYLGTYGGIGSSPLCEVLLDRIAEVSPRPPSTRPPAHVTGWLTNGQSSYSDLAEKARRERSGASPDRWVPPQDWFMGGNRVFLDVELFSWVGGQRHWSYSFIYAAWQLARLGMVDTRLLPQLIPAPWDATAGSWNDLPAVIQLNPDAAPFPSYHLVSPTASLPIGMQCAALAILDQYVIDPDVENRILVSANKEGVQIARELQDRIDYRAMPTVPTLRGMVPKSTVRGTLPDRTYSSLVLVGTSVHDDYQDLEDIPAVAHNLADLRRALTRPQYGAFDLDRAHILLNEGPYLPAKIAELGKDVVDTLMVYFAGHGLVALNGELCLARRDTRAGLEAYTSMPFSLLRQAVKDSPAKRKIVILDCCFAGRALTTLLASNPIHGQMEISGTYVLTATADNQPAHVSPGARNSVFTGELLNVLSVGLPDSEDLIKLSELYEVLRRRLHARNLPLPRQMGIDTVGDLAIARNPGWHRDRAIA